MINENEESKSMINTQEITLTEDNMEYSVALQELSNNLSMPKEAEQATGYMACLRNAGNFCRAIQCCCATCGSGPIQTIEEGFVGLRLEFGKL
jgi:hypothetical protein